MLCCIELNVLNALFSHVLQAYILYRHASHLSLSLCEPTSDHKD